MVNIVLHFMLVSYLISPFQLRFGRDTFQEAMKLVNRLDLSELDWENFRFMVFDQPNHPGTYEQRFNSIGKSLHYFAYYYLLSLYFLSLPPSLFVSLTLSS